MQHLSHPLAVGSRNLLVGLKLALALVLGLAVGGVEVVGPNQGEGLQQGWEVSGFGS